MPTEKKERKIQAIQDKFQQANALVLTDYRGLTANEMNEMREKFTKEDVDYRVVKNTLATIAAEQAGFDEDLGNFFQGPTAVAIGYDDPVLPFRLSAEVEDDYDNFTNKGGLLEGEVIDYEEFQEISQLSSREDLLSQVAVAFQAPLRKLAVALNAKVEQLANVLDQAKDQKSE